MELRVLNYFLAVAREENFTRAAEQLHLSQPTLSRQIAQLEEELGVSLFVRSNHSVILTAEGLMLKKRAQEILALAEKTKRDLIEQDKKLEGTLSIGSGEFLSTHCLTDCIAAFQQEYPQVRYEFYSGNAENVQDMLERGLLDLGLMSAPVNSRKYDFIALPIQEEWGILVRKDSPLAKKTVVGPKDLIAFPLISSLGTLMESRIAQWFGEFAGQLKIVARGNLLYNEAMLAESGLGVLLGIRLNYQYENLVFIPLSPPFDHTTALAWRKESFLSAAATIFIEFAKKYIKSIEDHEI